MIKKYINGLIRTRSIGPLAVPHDHNTQRLLLRTITHTTQPPAPPRNTQRPLRLLLLSPYRRHKEPPPPHHTTQRLLLITTTPSAFSFSHHTTHHLLLLLTHRGSSSPPHHNTDVAGVEPELAVRVPDERLASLLRHFVVAVLRYVVARYQNLS